MNKAILVWILMTGSFLSNAGTKKAGANGTWETAGTWIGGVIPVCGDSIVIPESKTVTIASTIDFSSCSSTKITVLGNLNIQSGKKLKLACNSKIYINNNAAVNSGGGGSVNIIEVCGTGQMIASQASINGPGCLPPDPSCSSLALPVEFSGLSASNSGRKIMLKWATSSEKENDYFTVEKSYGNEIFSEIARVAGRGTTNQLSEYAFFDENPGQGTLYYRIRQTDYNGHFSFSEKIAIKRKADITMSVYPNPSDGDFYVNTGGFFEGKPVTITLEDNIGRKLIEFTTESQDDNILRISVGFKKQKGMYILKLRGDNCLYSEKVILN